MTWHCCRLYVLYKLPQLKFLDSSAFKDSDRIEARQKGPYLGIVRIADAAAVVIFAYAHARVHTHTHTHSLTHARTHARTHAHTHTQPFNGLWSRTTQVGQYHKKHSPTHTHPDHRTSFINFLHLLRSITSSLFSLRAIQSSLTTSLQVLFGLPLGLGPSTS